MIAEERRRGTIQDTLLRAKALLGEDDIALSAISVVELTHGIHRAKTHTDLERRAAFARTVFSALIVHPVSFEIAQLAGRIEGEQAALGIAIGFEDLVIGATALWLGYGVVTLNVKHFTLIPGLRVVTL